MSETKEYASRVLENGTIQISDEVIMSIATAAIRDVEGVHGIGSNGGDLSRLTMKTAGKGIRVVISEKSEISVDCYIVVLYGFSVVDVAKSVQEAVTAAVESTTGQKVSGVNVCVSGITLPRAGKK